MPLYDAVRAPRPRKRDRKLHILIAIALTLVLLAFFPILWAAHLQRQYRHFISGLGESVLYAKAQGSLYVRQNGRQFRAQEPASRLYLEVNAAGMGKRQSSAPDSAPDAELEFGDGCILRFWGLDVWDGYNRQWVPGVFVWYRGANGKIYMYDTDRMQWQTLERDARHPNSSPSSKRCISCSVMVLLSPLKLYVNVMWSS